MKTIDIIKKEFPEVHVDLLISQGINEIAIIAGYEEIKTPDEYYTKYMNSISPVAPATYFNNNDVQCLRGRNRSFTDLYAIVRAKFIDLTISEFAYIFMKFQENGDQQFYTSYCTTVHKIVCKCHKSHNIKIPAHWILKDKKYIFNPIPNDLLSSIDERILLCDATVRACDGVYEHIIIKLANNYLESKNNETAIIKN